MKNNMTDQAQELFALFDALSVDLESSINKIGDNMWREMFGEKQKSQRRVNKRKQKTIKQKNIANCALKQIHKKSNFLSSSSSQNCHIASSPIQYQHPKYNSAQKSQNLEEILSTIPYIQYDPKTQCKLQLLTLFSVSQSRKQSLFDKYQQKQIQHLKALHQKYQSKYGKEQSNRPNRNQQGKIVVKDHLNKEHNFFLTKGDFQKLNPSTDLNDTIINTYLKILHLKIIPKNIAQKTYIFSSFFISKLLGDLLTNEEMIIADEQYQRILFMRRLKQTMDNQKGLKTEEDIKLKDKDLSLKQKVRQRVKNNYQSIKRWAKNVDLLQMQFIVFPICAFKHWNCIIVYLEKQEPQQVNYGKEKEKNRSNINIKLFLLDSMFQMRIFLPEAIKAYLQLLAQQKNKQNNNINLKISKKQLVVPRQTDHHDCGLFTLCYIQSFLNQPKYLKKPYKNHLFLLPRSLMYCMRSLIHILFDNLLKNKDQLQIQSHKNRMKNICIESDIQDYDTINDREFRKYYQLTKNQIQQNIKIKRINKQNKGKKINKSKVVYTNQDNFTYDSLNKYILQNQQKIEAQQQIAGTSQIQSILDQDDYSDQISSNKSNEQLENGNEQKKTCQRKKYIENQERNICWSNSVAKKCMLKFYLDPVINYFQKDKSSNFMQSSLKN